MVRPDWRERFALATDLALIGIVVTIAALPVLTAPAALAAGSVAVRRRYRDERFPPLRELLRHFRQTLASGVLALLAVLAGTAVLGLDLVAVRQGWVPGGPALLAATVGAAVWLSGLLTLTLVELGREPGTAWRAAWRRATRRPWCALAVALTGLVVAFLTYVLPPALPILLGFHLFAAHVITDRLTPTSPAPAAPAAPAASSIL